MRKGVLGRNATAAILQVTLSTALLFETFRYLAATVGPERIGVWSLVLATVAAGKLAEFGFGAGISRFVAGDLADRNTESAANTVFMATATTLGLALTIVAASFNYFETALLILVKPSALKAEAISILPYAMCSLVLGMLGSIYGGALDGMRRSDLKAQISVVGSLLMLLLTYSLTGKMGLIGTAIAQLSQNLFVTAASGIAIRRQLATSIIVGRVFSKRRFIELATFGGGMQLASLGQLAFEPIVKISLSHFGTLTEVGYYELSSKAATQLRGLIASAYQLLVPHWASKSKDGTIPFYVLRAGYTRSFGILTSIAGPYYGLSVSCVPLFFAVWVHSYDFRFTSIGLIVIAGWAFNTLAIPAWMAYMALGQTRWPIVTQCFIGATNLGLTYIFGYYGGGLGVIFGSVIAQIAGSCIIIFAFHRSYKISIRRSAVIIDRRSLLILVIAFIASGAIAYRSYSGGFYAIFLTIPTLLLVPIVGVHYFTSSRWKNIISQRQRIE